MLDTDSAAADTKVAASSKDGEKYIFSMVVSYLQNATAADDAQDASKNKIFYFDVGDDLYIIHTGETTGSSNKDGSAGTDDTINDMANATTATALEAAVSGKQALSSATDKNGKTIASINMHKFDTTGLNADDKIVITAALFKDGNAAMAGDVAEIASKTENLGTTGNNGIYTKNGIDPDVGMTKFSAKASKLTFSDNDGKIKLSNLGDALVLDADKAAADTKVAQSALVFTALLLVILALFFVGVSASFWVRFGRVSWGGLTGIENLQHAR